MVSVVCFSLLLLSHALGSQCLRARHLKRSELMRSLSSSQPTELYHSGDKILERFEQLAAKDCPSGVPLTVEFVNDTSEGAKPGWKLLVARLGSANAPKHALIVANEHARETITSEVVLRFVEQACDGRDSTELIESLKRVRFTIVPVANVAGRRKVDEGKHCLRYLEDEGEGEVDLNRNMDVDFEPSADHGQHPFSTYQARILRDLARAEKPQLYLDLHSGARTLMVPWGKKPAVNPDYPAQKPLLEQVAAKFCPDCKIGSNREVISYENPGEIIDHMYAMEGIKYTMLWELYQGDAEEGCLKYFNPTDRAEFESTVKAWTGAIGYVAHYMDQNISASERSSAKAKDIAFARVGAQNT